MMDNLHIFNTLTRRKDKFVPLRPGFVGIYVCGPTVYSHSHLGHAKSYISFDVIVRYLRYLGYKVRYVQNITDVGHLLGDFQEGEDRIEKQARLENLEPMEIVETYARSYFDDMDRLGVVRPNISPRASGHVVEQIEMIRILLNNGHAYENAGNVYFDISKFPEYGKLSGRKLEELEAGVRIEVARDKKHPADFALWKAADARHLMQWPSPWGSGYPGWHIECSCMSTKYLGQTFDIHGGGLENVFPHHECEIAQSESAFAQPFARYWIHNNMITVNGVKMSKSLNNYVSIKDALDKYNAQAIRYFILTGHYRSPVDFSDQALAAAEKGLKKLQAAISRIQQAINDLADTKKVTALPVEQYVSTFRAAMDDDFNTPQAIAAVFDLLTEVNRRLDTPDRLPAKADLVRLEKILKQTVGDVLGIFPEVAEGRKKAGEKMDAVMELVLDLRLELRKDKKFELSDQIRKRLEKSGIQIKDTRDGSTWKIEE
jgi:cysteinyl-tRNA synthetase